MPSWMKFLTDASLACLGIDSVLVLNGGKKYDDGNFLVGHSGFQLETTVIVKVKKCMNVSSMTVSSVTVLSVTVSSVTVSSVTAS